jgi:hypothetical protein
MKNRMDRISRFLEAGPREQGLVVARRESHGDYSLTVKYAGTRQVFKVDSRLYDYGVNREFYDVNGEQGHIPVYYDPGNPADAEIGEITAKSVADLRINWIAILLTIALPTILVVAVGESWVARERRLLKYGEVTSATVQRSHYFSNSRSSNTFIDFQFQSPFGTQAGTFSIGGAVETNFPVGLPIWIIYDPHKPKDVKPLLPFAPLARFNFVELA